MIEIIRINYHVYLVFTYLPIFQSGMFKSMPPLQRMPASALTISPFSPSSRGQNHFDESPIKEDGGKYPHFLEGKYNMKSRYRLLK